MDLALFETPRLIVRSFLPADAAAIHRILDAAFDDGSLATDPAALRERAEWVEWSRLSHRWFPSLHQPPFGDRAVVCKDTDELIGAVGLVPVLAPFAQLPGFGAGDHPLATYTLEMGLFWAIDPGRQRRGFATEAGAALIRFAFDALRVHRVVATTEHANEASQAVMRKLGMTLTRNPFPEPAWLQVVGVLTHSLSG